jgi:hypothetical protein
MVFPSYPYKISSVTKVNFIIHTWCVLYRLTGQRSYLCTEIHTVYIFLLDALLLTPPHFYKSDSCATVPISIPHIIWGEILSPINPKPLINNQFPPQTIFNKPGLTGGSQPSFMVWGGGEEGGGGYVSTRNNRTNRASSYNYGVYKPVFMPAPGCIAQQHTFKK